MHDGMPYGRNQGQGHSREVDRQSPTGLIFIVIVINASWWREGYVACKKSECWYYIGGDLTGALRAFLFWLALPPPVLLQ